MDGVGSSIIVGLMDDDMYRLSLDLTRKVTTIIDEAALIHSVFIEAFLRRAPRAKLRLGWVVGNCARNYCHVLTALRWSLFFGSSVHLIVMSHPAPSGRFLRSSS